MRAALLAAGALLLAVALAGCSPAVGASDEDSLPQTWNLCRNPELGFSIGYPSGWYTTHLRPSVACLYFEPRPFTIPANSDFTGTALEVLPEAQQTWENVVAGQTDERFARVLARSETTVAGVRAVRLETEATGEGLLERGTRQLAYVLDRDGAAWILQTTSRRGGGDYEARKDVLERAVETFRFDE